VSTYVRSVSNNGGWLLVNSSLTGGSNDKFGLRVALSANGDTLAMGSDDIGGVGVGAVQIYTAPAGTGTWTLQHTFFAIDMPGLSGGDMGQSIALSASGARLAVALPGVSALYTGGAVLVFERNASNAWNLEATLTRSNATLAGLGKAIAMNAAGDRIAVCELGQIVSGLVVIFVRDGSGGWSLVQTLEPTDSTPFLYRVFGMALALSDSGDTLAVTAWGELSRGAWWSVGIRCACCSCFDFAFNRVLTVFVAMAVLLCVSSVAGISNGMALPSRSRVRRKWAMVLRRGRWLPTVKRTVRSVCRPMDAPCWWARTTTINCWQVRICGAAVRRAMRRMNGYNSGNG
jgi:hypothetical protein